MQNIQNLKPHKQQTQKFSIIKSRQNQKRGESKNRSVKIVKLKSVASKFTIYHSKQFRSCHQFHTVENSVFIDTP